MFAPETEPQQAESQEVTRLVSCAQGLSAACNAAAGQVKAWAENLRATKSTLTIADTAAQLLDPATFASIRSPSDFAELWSEMGHAFKGVLAQLTPSTSGAQSSALVAVDYFLSVSWLLTCTMPLSTS